MCCCCDCPEFNHYDEVKAQQNFDEENMLQKQCSVDVLKNLTVNTVPTCTETNLQLPPGLTLRKIKINVEPNHEDKDENFYNIIREETGKNLVSIQSSDEKDMLQKQCSVEVIKNFTVNAVPIYPEIKLCPEIKLELTSNKSRFQKIKINFEPNHEDKDKNIYKIIREETDKKLVFTQTL